MPGFTGLADRSVITLTGPDRVSFLDRLITNSVPASGLAYATLLTPQGRVLTDLFLQPEADRLLIDCDAGITDELLSLLQRYRLRSAVTLTDDSTTYAAFAFDHPFEGAFPDPRLARLGWRAILPRSRLTDTDLADITDNYELQRLQLGIPRGLRDMPSRWALALECNLDHLHGINFSKGCFPGQELTTRMRTRKLLRRRLLPVELASATALPPGTPVLSANPVAAGEIRSSAGSFALALLRLDSLGEDLTANDCPLRVLWPDWLPHQGTH